MHPRPRRSALAALAVGLSLATLGVPAVAAAPPEPQDVAASSAPSSPTPEASGTAAPDVAAPTSAPDGTSAEPTAPASEPTPTPASPASTPAAPAAPEPTTAAGSGSASASGTLTYRGVTFTPPAGWPVVDLAADPTACVRLDRPAVYLGSQGPAPQCPSTLLGRTTTLQLQPVPAETPFGTVELPAGSVPELDAAQRVAGELVAHVVGTDVLVTATFGDDARPVLDVLAGLSASARREAAGTVSALAADAPPLDRAFTWFKGEGFDACTAPALSSMQAWLASPYRAVGVYIGGISRGCSQPNLTAPWLRSIAGMGWKAVPIYVGRQAPCSTYTNRVTYGLEWDQGREAALDAVARARELGLGSGSDIYYDMESYTRGSQCSGSVRAYLSAWTLTLREYGYSSGVYSSAATGIADLAAGAAQPGFVAPDKIWIARWTGTGSIYGHAPYVADNQWAFYQRMHQYRGGHTETWGGVTINIDNNLLDTDPIHGSPRGQLEATSTAPAKITVTGWALDPDTPEPIYVQMYVDGAPVALGRASAPRPDVAVAFPASGPDHGYSVTATASEGRHQVCLAAVNTGPGASVSLGCRTVDVPSSDPFGRLDVATGVPGGLRVSGWAIDPDTSASIIVQAYVDGALGAMGWADRSRPDVGAAFPAAGALHGFQLDVRSGPGRHAVCVYAVNTLAGSSTSLGCGTVDVPSGDPVGRVDAVSASGGRITVSGWAFDPDTTGPVIVQMYRGSQYVMGWADVSRPDIGAAFPAYGPNHGFTLSIAAPPGRQQVCLFAVNTGAGTTTTLGCPVVTV